MAASNQDPSSRPHFRKRLPVNPSSEHLKKQAKRRAKADPSLQLPNAQHQLAQEYGCKTWADLMDVVETMSRGADRPVSAGILGRHR